MNKKTLGSIILETTKLNTPLQTALINYDGQTRMVKLEHSNAWNITKCSRRERFEIIAKILLFCDRQRAKTSIMYKTNLNYTQLKSNLRFLTSQGLLLYNENKYVTTEKGYHFLSLFAQLNEILTC